MERSYLGLMWCAVQLVKVSDTDEAHPRSGDGVVMLQFLVVLILGRQKRTCLGIAESRT